MNKIIAIGIGTVITGGTIYGINFLNKIKRTKKIESIIGDTGVFMIRNKVGTHDLETKYYLNNIKIGKKGLTDIEKEYILDILRK